MVRRKQNIKIWEVFPIITTAIKRCHESEGGTFFGHDFDHALRVANYATIIAEDEKTARLAGLAGLCHNADRILQHKTGVGFYGNVPDIEITKLVNSWLDKDDSISIKDREIVLDAVLHHSKKNDSRDSAVLITLMDADRLVNIEADLIPREGQCIPNVHVIDPILLLNDPDADFFNPRSVIRHIKEILDWEIEGGSVGIRLPVAKKIAKSRFDFLKLFLKTIIDQRKEAGLIPYPEIKP
jgi:hypothetical protein